MSRSRNSKNSTRAGQATAFTIIELLVVIAIISLLLAILLPALSQAREEGRRIVCQSNMRMIGAAMNGYLGNDGQSNLPWTFASGSDDRHCIVPFISDDGRMVSIVSSYTWGGTIALRPFPGEVQSYDYCIVPAELRPLNPYMDSGASGNSAVKSVVCPGDRSAVSPFMDSRPPLQIESAEPSWARFGNSYSINWMFMDEPDLMNTWHVCDLFEHGRHSVRMNQGGKASEWVITWENQCDQLFLQANLVGNLGRIGPGWHRRFSFHTFLFLDGHAEHQYFDTRNARGPNWRIFRKWRLFNQPPFVDPPYG